MAGMTISSVASQKFGTESPRMAVLRAKKSASESWRVAEITPTGSAMARAKVSAKPASVSVTGSRWPISSSTGRRVHSDSPRSPRATWPSQSTYCTYSGRSRPSLARSSAMSRAYAFSESMSWTASPGMSRGSVKTISEAISSDGIATSTRFATYRFSNARLAVEPGRQQAAAVVVAHVRSVVLERAFPDGDVHAGRHLHVVLLLGQVALDVVDQLAPLGNVEGAPLAHEHVGDDRIVDVALVLQLVGVVLADQEVVGLQEAGLRAERRRVELAVEAGRDVGTVLLLVDPGVDADDLEVLLHELRDVDQQRGAVVREAHADGKAVRIAGRRQQSPGLGGIVTVILRALAELVERHRPLLQRGRHRRVHHTDALERRVDDRLAIDGQRHSVAHARVAEGLLVGAHRDVTHDRRRELGRLQPRPLLLERVLDLHPVGAVDRARKLPADVVLAAEEGRHAGGVVLVDGHLDAVDIGQTGEEVARVAHERQPHVGPVGVEHPGSGADHRLDLLEIAVLFDDLPGDDG